MSFQAQLVMVLWPLVVLFIFVKWSPQKAIIISFIAGTLFLPQRAGFSFLGFPDYDKLSAATYCILLGIILFDLNKIITYRFHWLDLSAIIFCLSPIASSLTNDLGLYDGLSGVIRQVVPFGFPYFMGRLYLNNSANLRLLATYIFIGGLIYVPLCLFEVRMSPILHQIVYGYIDARAFTQGIRFGGFRPSVFTGHGLILAMWMFAATLCGFYLWQSGILKKLWNIPLSILWPILFATLILVKSVGSIMYLFIGLIIFAGAKYLKTRLPLVILIFFICTYIFTGATGVLYQESLINGIEQTVTSLINEDRAESLIFRINNDEQLAEKARIQPLFGWGGWGRNRVYTENYAGELIDQSVTDSLWAIYFGTNGLVGLVSFFAITLLPSLIFCFRYPPTLWLKSKLLPAFITAALGSLYMLDCLFNAIPNPVYMIAAGGLAGFIIADKKTAINSLPSKPLPSPSMVRAKRVMSRKKV